jgi:hypothetical protein
MKKLNRERVQKLYVDAQFEKMLPVIPMMMITDILEDEEKAKEMIYGQLIEAIDKMSNKELYDSIREDYPELLEKYNDELAALQSAEDEPSINI